MNLTLICISFIVQQIALIYLLNVICQSLIATNAMLAYFLFVSNQVANVQTQHKLFTNFIICQKFVNFHKF